MSIDEFLLTTNEFMPHVKMYSIVDKNEFVFWLQSEMDKRDWSQADLAREANLSRGAVGNVLRQERDPGKDFLIGIAKALNLPIEEVFRIAGLLPPEVEESEQEMELRHLYRLLPAGQQKQMLEYARFLLAQAEAEEKRKKR